MMKAMWNLRNSFVFSLAPLETRIWSKRCNQCNIKVCWSSKAARSAAIFLTTISDVSAIKSKTVAQAEIHWKIVYCFLGSRSTLSLVNPYRTHNNPNTPMGHGFFKSIFYSPWPWYNWYYPWLSHLSQIMIVVPNILTLDARLW